MTDMKRDERGRVAQRVPGKYSNKIFACRVTDNEMELIRKARNMGIDVRKVLLTEIRKQVHDESAER